MCGMLQEQIHCLDAGFHSDQLVIQLLQHVTRHSPDEPDAERDHRQADGQKLVVELPASAVGLHVFHSSCIGSMVPSVTGHEVPSLDHLADASAMNDAILTLAGSTDHLI